MHAHITQRQIRIDAVPARLDTPDADRQTEPLAGQTLDDRAVLLDVAQSIGLERAACEAWLSDEALGREVRGEESYWINENVSGVPAIIFDGKYMVPGAQSAETFAQVIGKVLAKRDQATA